MNIVVFISLLTAMLMLFILWRTKKTSSGKAQPNTLLKVRKKRTGTIDSDVNASVLLPNMPQPFAPGESEVTLEEPPALPNGFVILKLLKKTEIEEDSEAFKNYISFRKPHPLLMSLSKSITNPQELIQIVKSDPELVAKVLNLANSPFFGLRKIITDVNHAVIYLGVTQVKNIATQFAIAQSFEFASDEQKKAYDYLWKTSFFASAIALVIGQDAQLENTSELSTRCLLSFLGDIALLSIHSKASMLYAPGTPLYSRILDTQNKHATNGAILGSVLGQHVKLPPDLCRSIAYSYQPMLNDWEDIDIDEEEKRNVVFCYAICTLAEYFVLQKDTKFSASPSFSYDTSHKPELYHLQTQLEEVGLGHLNKLLQSPRIKIKLSQMLNDLHNLV